MCVYSIVFSVGVVDLRCGGILDREDDRMKCPIDGKKCVPKDCCFGLMDECTRLRYCVAVELAEKKAKKGKR